MFVCIVGSPLSGKSTIAQQVAAHLCWPILETGKIAREFTPEDERKIGFEDRYEYAEEKIRETLYERRYLNHVVDGFPRSVDQAEFLVYNKIPFWLIFLSINPVLQYSRMNKRGRSDDTINKLALRTLAARRLWQDLMLYCGAEKISTIAKFSADDPEKTYREIRGLLDA